MKKKNRSREHARTAAASPSGFARGAGLLSVALGVSIFVGCASTAPPPADFRPVDSLPALSELAEAREGSTVDFVEREGGPRIPVRVLGDDGSGLPVLLTHGLQSHSGWFVQSARFIADLGFPVYALDRRGSGLSEARRGDCDDFRDMIAEIDAVADHVRQKHDVGKVHLLGHCFGAVPAAAFACEHPEKLASLVLTTPAIHTRTSVGFAEKMTIFWAHLTGSETYIEVPLVTEQFSELARYQKFIGNDPLSLRKATASFYWEIPRARRFIRNHADRLDMPIFAALAGKDPICDNEANTRFLCDTPSERMLLVTYSEARHILEFSAARDAFFADVQHWLTGVGDPQ